MAGGNLLSRTVARLSGLPPGLRSLVVTFAFGRRVPFVATGGIRIEALEEGRAVMTMKNRRRIQNHLGGIHATAMALLAETATGAAVGMTLPDSRIPLLKSMHVDYVRRAGGTLRAEASLPAELRARVRTDEKGEVVVPVRITDASGEEPIKCQLTWAWIPRKK